MKQPVCLLILFLTFTGSTFAQNSRLKEAKNLFESDQFNLARTAIDSVVIHPETKKSAEAWFYRGEIYHALYELRLDFQDKRSFELIRKSYESYMKTLQFDKEEKFDHIAIFKILDFDEAILKTGVSKMNQGDFPGAYEVFKYIVKTKEAGKALLKEEINPELLFYLAFSASVVGETEESKTLFHRLINEDYQNITVYQTLSELYRNEENMIEAQRILEMGLKEFPHSMELLLDQINLYISLNQTDQVLGQLNKIIEKDSTNPEFHFTVAAVHEELGNEKKAIEHYRKSLRFNKDFLQSNYNLAVLYYNKALSVHEQLNNLNNTDSIYNSKLRERNTWLAEAKPYLEKSHQLDPKNESIIQVLNNIKKVLNNHQ